MANIVVLTGAGMSAESGLKTFRDAGGLWEGHDVMQVASPEGWAAHRELVLDFYNQRRRQLLTVKPNDGHKALVRLEDIYHVQIVTQNVDDLHERAGSTHVLHLHGELLKARSSVNPDLVYEWKKDLVIGDTCAMGSQLRPHVVWFGEAVPAMQDAITLVAEADIVIIIGTSMQVYPAAGLVHFARPDARTFYIDPRPQVNHELARVRHLRIIEKPAGSGTPELVDQLISGELA